MNTTVSNPAGRSSRRRRWQTIALILTCAGTITARSGGTDTAAWSAGATPAPPQELEDRAARIKPDALDSTAHSRRRMTRRTTLWSLRAVIVVFVAVLALALGVRVTSAGNEPARPNSRVSPPAAEEVLSVTAGP